MNLSQDVAADVTYPAPRSFCSSSSNGGTPSSSTDSPTFSFSSTFAPVPLSRQALINRTASTGALPNQASFTYSSTLAKPAVRCHEMPLEVPVPGYHFSSSMHVRPNGPNHANPPNMREVTPAHTGHGNTDMTRGYSHGHLPAITHGQSHPHVPALGEMFNFPVNVTMQGIPIQPMFVPVVQPTPSPVNVHPSPAMVESGPTMMGGRTQSLPTNLGGCVVVPQNVVSGCRIATSEANAPPASAFHPVGMYMPPSQRTHPKPV
ncbi:unnamed protein product [Chrysoparadoxa australica]